MIRTLAAFALFVSSPLSAAQETEIEPDAVSEIDAINCKLDVPHYLAFAMAIEDIADTRRWKKIESANPFLQEYELPTPIVVAGSHSTKRIALSSSGILAVLDLPDPAAIAREEKIENEVDLDPLVAEVESAGEDADKTIKFRKFLGERVLVDRTEPAPEGESFGSRTIIARSISNATSHPGKTLFGCTYRLELLDENGDPL